MKSLIKYLDSLVTYDKELQKFLLDKQKACHYKVHDSWSNSYFLQRRLSDAEKSVLINNGLTLP